MDYNCKKGMKNLILNFNSLPLISPNSPTLIFPYHLIISPTSSSHILPQSLFPPPITSPNIPYLTFPPLISSPFPHFSSPNFLLRREKVVKDRKCLKEDEERHRGKSVKSEIHKIITNCKKGMTNLIFDLNKREGSQLIRVRVFLLHLRECMEDFRNEFRATLLISTKPRTEKIE